MCTTVYQNQRKKWKMSCSLYFWKRTFLEHFPFQLLVVCIATSLKCSEKVTCLLWQNQFSFSTNYLILQNVFFKKIGFFVFVFFKFFSKVYFNFTIRRALTITIGRCTILIKTKSKYDLTVFSWENSCIHFFLHCAVHWRVLAACCTL